MPIDLQGRTALVTGASRGIGRVVGSSVYRPIGTLDQVREHIVRVRRETGITYFCLRGPPVEELAPVVRDLAGT